LFWKIAKIPVKLNKINIKQNATGGTSKLDNERKDLMNVLSRQSFESKNLEKYSNQLLVTNLPDTITLSELKEIFATSQKVDLKHKPKTVAYVTYSSAKEAMEARIALKPTIAKEKFRVIIMLLNYTRKKPIAKKDKHNEGEKEKKSVRYFDD
jgi:hypothetical protein